MSAAMDDARLQERLIEPASRHRGFRVAASDGTTPDRPDEVRNREAFGPQGASRGETVFPKARLSMLLETGARAAGRPDRGERACAGGGSACASEAWNAGLGRPRLFLVPLAVNGFRDRSRPAPARADACAPAS